MMIHPEIQAALVRERTRAFLAEAEAARRSRLLGRSLGRPLPRPSGGRPVRLRDGSAMLIRPVRPEDAGLLEDGLAGLRDFTDVDHRDHEALGALAHVRGGDVGIARYGTLEYEMALACVPSAGRLSAETRPAGWG